MLYYIIPYIIIPLVVLFIIGGVIRRSFLKKKGVDGQDQNEKDDFLQAAFSKEDALMQILSLVGYGYLFVVLMALNNRFGGIIDFNWMILIAGVIGVLIGYYLKILYVGAFGVVSVAGWVLYKIADLMLEIGDMKPMAYVGVMGLIGIVVYLIAYYHSERFKRFALISGVLGGAIITSVIFLLSSQIGLGFFADNGNSFWVSWPISLIVILLLAVIAGQLVRFVGKKVLKMEGLMIVVLALICVAIMFVPEIKPFVGGSGYYGNRELTEIGVGLAILFNAILFIHLAMIVVFGYLKKSIPIINLGGLILFVTIIFKYFSWFWTLIDRSAFFVVAGILLVGLGWLMERSRRKIVSEIKSN